MQLFSYRGLIINVRKFSNFQYIINILTESNGRWSGIVSCKTQPILCSLIDMSWKSKSISSLGKISFDIIKESICIRHWNFPVLIATINALCRSCMLIPERIHGTKDFDLFNKILQSLCAANYEQHFIRWESYLIENYTNINYANTNNLQSYIISTPELDSQSRNDLLKLHECFKKYQ